VQEQRREHNPDYDERLMILVESALGKPPGEREAFLRQALPGDSEEFRDAWHYVKQEERMNGFLLDPCLPTLPEDVLLEPGALLQQRFRIIRKIAHGGMGVVYEARDEKLDRRIAIKCAKSRFEERLPPEVRNASAISHPNVCKLFEIHTGSASGSEFDFLTMEYLDGETLADRLRRGPLDRQEAKTIASQLCDGLAEAHRNQVIHADLKPGNVILTRSADGALRAVITDFGLAAGSGEGAPAAGTPSYMAPELLSGEKPSQASDIYALGVILYELAAGQKPWPSGLDPEQRLKRKPPAIHHPWNQILQRCLDPDPNLRPDSAASVGRAVNPAASLRVPLAVAALLAALGIVLSVWMYIRVNAPEQTVRLAILPFEAGTGAGELASRLFKETSAEFAKLQGNHRTGIQSIPAGPGIATPDDAKTHVNATHAIQAKVTRDNGKIAIHVQLFDTGLRAKSTEWKALYAEPEMPYIPVAMAGLVTRTFHIPALPRFDAVNAAAQADYQAGINFLQKDSTVDEGLAHLERAVAADSDSALTHAALAEARWWKFFITGDRTWRDRAAASVAEAERRNPDLPAVHASAGLLLRAVGWREQALAEYLRALELEPRNGDVLRRVGMVYDDLKELDKALAALQRSVEVAPNNHRNHQALGTYWRNRDHFRQAAKHFQRTVELAPGESSGRFALGAAYGELGKFAESESELRQAMALRESARVLNALGTTLTYMNRDRDAIPYFLRAVKLDPNASLWRINLAIAYRRASLPAKASETNRQALKLAEAELKTNPRDAFARACLGYVCGRLGDRDRAQAEIAQALQLSPEDSNTRRMAVKTYEVLGLREDALAIIRTSLAEVVEDLGRYPDLADLHRDSRFKAMLANNSTR